MEATKTTKHWSETLREEDLVPGRPWVHPESRLEYEDFHAFFCGKDPVPHWRNAEIKRLLREGPSRDKDGVTFVHPTEGTGSYRFAEYFQLRVDELFRLYTREGYPYVATRVDEHGLSFAPA